MALERYVEIVIYLSVEHTEDKGRDTCYSASYMST